MKTVLAVLVSVLATTAAAASAHAQMGPEPTPEPVPEPPPPPAVTVAGPARQGFTIGFAIGPGAMRDEDESVSGGAVSFRLGAAITPGLLVQGDLELVSSAVDGGTLTLDYTGASVTGYVHPRFFLTGGLGFVQFAIHADDGDRAETDPELGVMLGLGVEAYQSRRFALSIELRSFGASFDGTTLTTSSLLVGFQWF